LTIKNRRTERIIRDIIYGYIADGKYPPLDTVLRDLARRQNEFTLGLDPITKQNIITSDPINKAMDQTEDTLQLLHDELDELYTKYRDFVTITRNEYKKMAEWERTISCKIDDIIHASSAATAYFHSWWDSFNNLKRIDTTLTTAQLRLESGEAHLHTNLNLSKQLSLTEVSTSSPSVLVDDANALLYSENVSFLSNAFDGNFSTYWAHDVATSKNMGVSLTLRINLTSGQINHVDIEPYTLGPTQITIYGSRGDKDIQWGQAVTTAGRVSYGGNPEGVTGVLLKFYKDHFDFMEQDDSGIRYVYRFGASEIILRKEAYDTIAELISIPIEMPTELAEKYTLSSASIDVDESTPEGTDIQYYLGAEPADGATSLNDIIWYPVSPANAARDENIPRTVFFAPGNSRELLIEPENIAGDDISPSDSAVPIYLLQQKGDDKILIESLSAYVGWGQGLLWRQDSSDPNYLGLSYWADKSTNDDVVSAYLDAGSFSDLFLIGEYGYLAEYGVEIPAALDVMASFSKPADWEAKVFLNGVEIPFTSTGRNTAELQFEFKEGINWVHVTTITDGNQGYVRLGMELSRFGNVYLWKPLVTDFAQLPRVDTNTMYASWDGGLFTNFDPSLEPHPTPDVPLTPGEGYLGCTYMPRVFCTYYDKGATETQTIRFRAQLSRNLTTEATPRLREYHVRMKHGG
jgi:hypothetical protein